MEYFNDNKAYEDLSCDEIFTIKQDRIDDKLAKKILHKIKPERRIGLDMKHVKSICSPVFIYNLINNKFKLFNLKNEALIYLALILKDGRLKSYMGKEDFLKDKRELVIRRFRVV